MAESRIKKGAVMEGMVRATHFPNRGDVQIIPDEEGTTDRSGRVLVKNVLPGQQIRLRITKKRKDRCEGVLLEVTGRSPEEVESDCVHFPECGGCLMRTLPYTCQLELKEKQVREILESVCPQLPFEGIIPSPDVNGYRNKMEFSFGDRIPGGPLELGLHRKGSFYDVLTTDRCMIVDEDFRLILRTVLDLTAAYELPYYHKVRHEGYLRHLLIRKGRNTGQILAALVTGSGFACPDQSKTEGLFLAELVDALTGLDLKGKLTGLLHIRNDRVSDTISADEIRTLYGQNWFIEKLDGLSFKISPFSFFQTNTAGAQVLYRKVCEYASVENGMSIYDLYSGTGTIAQMLAGVAGHVTGVEIVGEAVEAARENAERNGLENCTFIAGDVLSVLDELEEKPDMIILDPPRDGVHPKALNKIISYGVKRMVYISCKVTSLARDLPVLREAGYCVERCCCVDMFPATANIETVVLLSREM